MPTTAWLVCEEIELTNGRSFCMYTEASATRLKSDPLRCIQHGRILSWAHTKASAKAEARKELS